MRPCKLTSITATMRSIDATSSSRVQVSSPPVLPASESYKPAARLPVDGMDDSQADTDPYASSRTFSRCSAACDRMDATRASHSSQ